MQWVQRVLFEAALVVNLFSVIVKLFVRNVVAMYILVHAGGEYTFSTWSHCLFNC